MIIVDRLPVGPARGDGALVETQRTSGESSDRRTPQRAATGRFVVTSSPFDFAHFRERRRLDLGPGHALDALADCLDAEIRQPAGETITRLDRLASRIVGAPEHWALARGLLADLGSDNLVYASGDDVIAMAQAGTVAVLLPGAFYTLREDKLPPIEEFRQRDVPMAVATDANPGSSPMTSILLAMNMACTLFRMTPAEALAGVTVQAARALGLPDRGCIRAGMRADLCVWDVAHPAELSYRIGFNPLVSRLLGGKA